MENGSSHEPQHMIQGRANGEAAELDHHNKNPGPPPHPRGAFAERGDVAATRFSRLGSLRTALSSREPSREPAGNEPSLSSSSSTDDTEDTDSDEGLAAAEQSPAKVKGQGLVQMDAELTHSRTGAWALVRDMGSRLTFWQGQGRNVAKDLVRKLSTDSPILGTGMQSVPCLTVVMLVTGTRGDVQPFIALAQTMQEYGHRVRLATHAVYRDFVEEHGLEFYPLGGNPQVLSEYMVKNKGIIPGSYHDIVTQRKELRDIVFSMWPACTQPDPEHLDRPFRAEAVIANPVAYGHEQCAEALDVPLHMVFTMPWTPTGSFPHPMARIMYTMKLADGIRRRNKRLDYYADVKEHYQHLIEAGELGKRSQLMNKARDTKNHMKGWAHRAMLRQMRAANKLSYAAMDDLMHQGVADLLDRLRTEELGLPSMKHEHGYAHYYVHHKTPFTYAFSPFVAPKPKDWGSHIDVAGYFIMDESKQEYQPHQSLTTFLETHPAPVYIGFGSLVVSNPERLSKLIFKALRRSGLAAIISKGWGQLGVIEGEEPPDNVLLVDAVPHDWLFPRCQAVIHHGGAGTTAAGLLASCPTTVVPFFGDQSFWGEAVFRAGLGPRPVPIGKLSVKRLVHALEVMKDPQVKQKTAKICTKLKQEQGAANGMAAFHRHLPRRYLAQKGQEQQRRRPAVTSSPDDRFSLDAGEQDSSPAASEGEDEDSWWNLLVRERGKKLPGSGSGSLEARQPTGAPSKILYEHGRLGPTRNRTSSFPSLAEQLPGSGAEDGKPAGRAN